MTPWRLLLGRYRRTADTHRLAWWIGLAAWAVAGTVSAGEPLRIVVSVPPQKAIVEQLGGDRVRVSAMVRPGQSPHLYEPTPRQISELSRTDAYVLTGVPFEQAWMARISAANPAMRMVDGKAGIELRVYGDDEHHDHGESHRDGAPDPHVWTSPPLVQRVAANIHAALVEMDPANEANYDANLRAFEGQLETLDRDIRSTLSDLPPGSSFMVYHPSWGYFAETYGLTQLAIEREGKEPGPRGLAALIEQARRENVRVVFVQPQFSQRVAEQVARAIDGRVVAVDPLAEDFAANLRLVATRIAEAVREGRG